MSYQNDGNIIIPDLISPALCDVIVTHAMNEGDEDKTPLYMPHRNGENAEFFLAIMCLPELVREVERLFKGEASGLGSEYFFSKPGTKGFSAHQDNVWVQAPKDSFVHVWIALTDVGTWNGGLTFWPSTHKLGLLKTRDLNEDAGKGQNPGARKMECIIPEGYESEDITLNKGDVVIWDSYLVHASKDNDSNEFRHALLMSYLKKGSKFNPGSKQKRVEVDLHN